MGLAGREEIDHYNDGSAHKDLFGKLATAMGEDGVRPLGSWKEWVHQPKQQVGSVQNPGRHRVILGENGEVFYTTDHYQTYVKIAGDYSEWSVFPNR